MQVNSESGDGEIAALSVGEDEYTCEFSIVNDETGEVYENGATITLGNDSRRTNIYPQVTVSKNGEFTSVDGEFL